jgi:hypothetical protein
MRAADLVGQCRVHHGTLSDWPLRPRVVDVEEGSMPESLTLKKTSPGVRLQLGTRPASNRNRGRLQIGMVSGFASESLSGINRNPPHLGRTGLLWDLTGARDLPQRRPRWRRCRSLT